MSQKPEPNPSRVIRGSHADRPCLRGDIIAVVMHKPALINPSRLACTGPTRRSALPWLWARLIDRSNQLLLLMSSPRACGAEITTSRLALASSSSSPQLLMAVVYFFKKKKLKATAVAVAA